MIQASIAPLPSMSGTLSSCIRPRTRSSDHGALATKCSSDWCLAETRAGAVTAAIGSTLLRSRQQQAPAIITQRLGPIGMPDHLDQHIDIGRKPFLLVLAHALFPKENALSG